jgi:hypothetical protein
MTLVEINNPDTKYGLKKEGINIYTLKLVGSESMELNGESVFLW